MLSATASNGVRCSPRFRLDGPRAPRVVGASVSFASAWRLLRSLSSLSSSSLPRPAPRVNPVPLPDAHRQHGYFFIVVFPPTQMADRGGCADRTIGRAASVRPLLNAASDGRMAVFLFLLQRPDRSRLLPLLAGWLLLLHSALPPPPSSILGAGRIMGACEQLLGRGGPCGRR
jgi:hypothetical protein